MVAATYSAFCDRMIQRYEGGYGWDRGDPGGPTKYGITCYDLAEHRGQKMDSMARWAPIVKAMTLAEAEEIYKIKYARRLRYNDLRAGCDTVIFDYGVNSGISRPIRVARALVNLQEGNASMTDLLVERINAADPKWFIDAMCAERLHFMHGIRGGAMWSQFGKGWGARVNDLEGYSEHIAVGSEAPHAPDLSKVPTPKARHVAPAGRGTVGTVGSAAGGAAVHTLGLPAWAVATAVGVGIAGTAAFVVWSQHKAALANRRVIIPASVPAHP